LKYIIALSLSFALLTGCKSTEELTPVSKIKQGVAKEGTLANAKLILDAKAGLEKVIGATINDSELLKFVIQQPVGEVGSRSWREMWIIKKADEASQFLITFKEVGLGGADFEIKKMNESTAREDCPTTVNGFEQGQSNLFIKECLGTPDHVDQNPDGRYVYLYNRPNGIVVTYLFSKENKFTKFTAYQDTNKT
jgi:outer membrane protein assembly factor BamE (lipoprotein component of BamABCDE complex)